MIEEEAIVIECKDDKAVIKVNQTTGCNTCHSKSACGTASLAKWFQFKSPELSVKNTLSASVGDRVIVAIDDSMLLKSSFLLYIFPLACLFLFAFIADLFLRELHIEQTELLIVLAGLFGLIAGIFSARKLAQVIFNESDSARMKKILNRHASVFPVLNEYK